MSPNYPSFYKKPVSSKWKITGKESQLIEIVIEEFKFGKNVDNVCDRTLLIIKETLSGQIIEKLCKINETKIIQSKTSSVTILFETSGEPEGIKYKIKFKMSNIFVKLL